MIADMDLVKREEFEAMKTLARSALEKAEALERRVADLEAKLGGSEPADRRP
jgi:BMFP domain-containing protein YqiC